MHHSFSQKNESPTQDHRDSIIIAWVQNLYSSDFIVEGDSAQYLYERNRLLTDEDYRRLVYPETYTWQMAAALIERQQLKMAFWYFINLYMVNEEDKEKVIKCVLTYNNLFRMDEVLFSTFYTYCNTDPKINEIVDGKSKMIAPHIMEEKEDAMIDILAHIKQYQIENGLIEHDHGDGHNHHHGEGSDHDHKH